jgi:hypothetical protein
MRLILDYIAENESAGSQTEEVERLRKENESLEKEIATLKRQGEKWNQLHNLLLTE